VFDKGAIDIVNAVSNMIGKNIDTSEIIKHKTYPHDVPGDWFKGPF
jgi:pyruvate dehydrogenase E1 component beta subunit